MSKIKFIPDRERCQSISDELFWTQFTNSVSKFCLDFAIDNSDNNKIISSLVGEDLDWCGASSFMFMALKYSDMKKNYSELESRCKYLESNLSAESFSALNLRKQLRQLQILSQDNEWQLQEQLAQANMKLNQEKEINSDLKNKIAILESNLTEVEIYFNSERGSIALQLEQDLAASKLRIAELEAEKDEYELNINICKSIPRGKVESIDDARPNAFKILTLP